MPSPVRPETDINDGFDPLAQEDSEEIHRVPAAVPVGVTFYWDLATALFDDIL